MIVDDYSKFTWVYFLENEDKLLEEFKNFSKKIENEKEMKIKIIRSDHGAEFKF